ncbi:MAG: hypothetical protein ACUVWK_06185 [Nitrososphaerales archaeon]
MGQHLSRSVCLGLNCPYCRDAPCLFREVYVPRPSKRGHAQPPKPVIIVPPFFAKKIDLPAGGRIEVDVVVFGGYTRSFLQLLLGMIAFGQSGIGPDRHYGGNRFEVASVKCLESGGYVLQNSNIYSDSFATKDVKDLEPLSGGEVVMSFKTPFTGAYIPLTLRDIARLIRHRLILFVNEYGSGEDIPSIDVEGNITIKEVHRHVLQRRSIRSDKDFFHGWTGAISIEMSRLSEKARWLFSCASIVGMGPDSAFGSGFVEITQPEFGQ